jgi:membrane dipeptidase
MNRREFSLMSATVVALGGATAAIANPPSSRRTTLSAQALYHRALVLDCNLGPDLGDSLPLSTATLATIGSSGVSVMKTTMGGFGDDFDGTMAEIAFYLQAIEVHPDVFMQVRSAADFETAKRSKKNGIIFSFEGVGMLDGKIERIELFRHLGVRVMQLSYNDTSPFAAGVLASPSSAGVSPLGREAIGKMNQLGVAIDLSHANAQTTRDALAQSTRPVLITHAGCSAIHAHPRNKTDEQLRALADKGGVLGIYDLPYLTASPRQPTVEDYLDHMAHALTVCGEDHVGIGSDQAIQPFDDSPQGLQEFQEVLAKRHAAGVAAPEEDRPLYVVGMNRPDRCEIVADGLLKRGYHASVTEKVLGRNFVRVLSEIWSV